MTEIYNSWNPTTSNIIGHMDDTGVVYNHWSREGIENSVGHVDRDGVVYSHWSREGIEDSVGHVDKDGIVYSHWSREGIEDSVGHVGKDGVVYSHWSREGIGDSVGCVKGGNIYAAGAAFLLLNASFNGTSDDYQPPVHEEEWRRERAEHEAEMQRIRNRNAIRAAKMQEYKNNPKIVAAAKEYAQQRVKTATVVAPVFFAMLCVGGFKNMTREAIVPVIAIVGLFALVMTLFVRRMTYKNAFEKKVWELGEQGYGSEPVEKPKPKGNRPARESEATHTPDPEHKPAGSKIVTCPHCGAKCKIPVGVGTIQITCPNPGCNGKTFIIDS